MDVLIVTLASALAGFVDSIVGGGGLILVPALFATFPTAPPATMLGSNKSAALWGAAFSTWRYSQHVSLVWRTVLVAAAFTFIGACLGPGPSLRSHLCCCVEHCPWSCWPC